MKTKEEDNLAGMMTWAVDLWIEVIREYMDDILVPLIDSILNKPFSQLDANQLSLINSVLGDKAEPFFARRMVEDLFALEEGVQ